MDSLMELMEGLKELGSAIGAMFKSIAIAMLINLMKTIIYWALLLGVSVTMSFHAYLYGTFATVLVVVSCLVRCVCASILIWELVSRSTAVTTWASDLLNL